MNLGVPSLGGLRRNDRSRSMYSWDRPVNSNLPGGHLEHEWVENCPIEDEFGEGSSNGDPDGLFSSESKPGEHHLGAWIAVYASIAAGMISLTGMWLSDLLAERQKIAGSFVTAKSVEEKIKVTYVDAWHASAFTNGLLALFAIILPIAVLLAPSARKPFLQSAQMRALGVMGFLLGILGVAAAAGVYFDLLTTLPRITPGTAQP